jgi:hypothetical protein
MASQGQVISPFSQYISPAQPQFDGPKVGGVNSTSFDWWFFDAVTKDGRDTLAVVFGRSTDPAVSSVSYLELEVAFANGDQIFPAVLRCHNERHWSKWS